MLGNGFGLGRAGADSLDGDGANRLAHGFLIVTYRFELVLSRHIVEVIEYESWDPCGKQMNKGPQRVYLTLQLHHLACLPLIFGLKVLQPARLLPSHRLEIDYALLQSCDIILHGSDQVRNRIGTVTNTLVDRADDFVGKFARPIKASVYVLKTDSFRIVYETRR